MKLSRAMSLEIVLDPLKYTRTVMPTNEPEEE